jgi:hypothetical protein
MIDFKAFFISSCYISSLSKHVKQTLWSDTRLQEKCIKNKTAINQCLCINYSFNFQFHGSQFWSIYFHWNCNWLAHKFVVFNSLHYAPPPPPEKNLANNMYKKDVMNRAPTLLSHKAQPYFSVGHAVPDKWELFSILHKYCSEKEEWAGLTWQLWATLSDSY